jgi:hypothetical protein
MSLSLVHLPMDPTIFGPSHLDLMDGICSSSQCIPLGVWTWIQGSRSLPAAQFNGYFFSSSWASGLGISLTLVHSLHYFSWAFEMAQNSKGSRPFHFLRIFRWCPPSNPMLFLLSFLNLRWVHTFLPSLCSMKSSNNFLQHWSKCCPGALLA